MEKALYCKQNTDFYTVVRIIHTKNKGEIATK